MAKQLSAPQVTEMLCEVAQALIGKVDVLTEADLATGDGDHGIGMRRGAEAALEALGATPELSVQGAFKQTGMAIMSKTGGAAGAVFGTFFRGGAKAFDEVDTLTATGFRDFLGQSAAAVSKRGGVEEGAKTMVDAVAWAARRAAEADGDDLSEVLSAAERGALEGVEATKEMIATTGKARSLGERSLGHPDPGAISVSIILGAMKTYAAGQGD